MCQDSSGSDPPVSFRGPVLPVSIYFYSILKIPNPETNGSTLPRLRCVAQPRQIIELTLPATPGGLHVIHKGDRTRPDPSIQLFARHANFIPTWIYFNKILAPFDESPNNELPTMNNSIAHPPF